MNHFHSRTNMDGSVPTFGIPQQAMASMFGQRYTHTAPSFSMLNIGSDPYSPGVMAGHTETPMTIRRDSCRTTVAYTNPYSTVAYTNPIPLSGSLMEFLPNHAYQNTMWYNAYGQPKNCGFGTTNWHDACSCYG
jgi:hypothetical protein